MKAGIAGAGILGRLLALALVNKGWEVSLFDQDDMQGNASCSMAAAGLLTPISEIENSHPLASVIFNLGLEGLEHGWGEILKQLDKEIYFRNTGTLITAHPREHAELTRFGNTILNKIGANYIQALSQTALQQLEPELTKVTNGYYIPQEGQIDNQELMGALLTKLQIAGVNWYPQCLVQEIQPQQIIVKQLNSSATGTSKKFDMVFDCRGLGAKSSFPNLRGIRGELLWLHAPDVGLSRPIRLLHPRYNLYVVPRPQNIYILGASEIETEDNSMISVRTTLELLSAAYYLHPGFIEARIIKSVTNCRPTLPDHMPKIRYTDGFIAVNGLYRRGFLITPALISDIIGWLDGGLAAVRFPQLWEHNSDDYHSLE